MRRRCCLAVLLASAVLTCSAPRPAKPADRTSPAAANLAPALPEPLRAPAALLASLEKTLPTDHPRVLEARLDLARAWTRAGDPTQARGLQESALEMLMRTVPSDHPLLLRARLELAETLHTLGDLAGAHPLAESAVVQSNTKAGTARVGFRVYETLDASTGARSARLQARVGRALVSPELVELGDVSSIERLVTSWRASLGVPSKEHTPSTGDVPPGEHEAGVALRERVLDPILKSCADVRTLYVQLDGPLQLVPLDALPLEDVRVGDKLRVLDVLSLEALDAGPGKDEGTGGLVALGGIDFDAGAKAGAPPASGRKFAAWPESKYEVGQISELYRHTIAGAALVLKGASATKVALLEKVASARYLHIATRGFFVPDSPHEVREVAGPADARALCGLALAGANVASAATGDGVITAEEISKLDLSRCELAVLSASDSRRGVLRAGQPPASLHAALHQAGARATLTCLWKADETWTQTLLVEFYRAMWAEKKSMSDALWSAKKALREMDAPIQAWAGWVLTGANE